MGAASIGIEIGLAGIGVAELPTEESAGFLGQINARRGMRVAFPIHWADEAGIPYAYSGRITVGGNAVPAVTLVSIGGGTHSRSKYTQQGVPGGTPGR